MVHQSIPKKDQDILTLAVKCKFITPDQEKKILTHFLPCIQEEPDRNIIDVFKEFQLISKEEIAFLMAIRDHLTKKQLDIRFGKLAVANNFTSQDIIKKALDRQTAHFKKNRHHLLLGDILVKAKQISEPDKTAILLTQDRISDANLADALNVLAKTELEKLAASKRFGSIAVSKGYVTIDDVNNALRLQNTLLEQKGIKKFLGQILEESFGLSPDATLDVLNEQKRFEKRRLNLEKALSSYNAEIKNNQTLSKLFECRVSDDKLEAYVRITRTYDTVIPPQHLVNWVKLMGIRYGVVDDIEIESFLLAGIPGSELKIAQGDPPRTGTDATVEFHFDHHFKAAADKKESKKQAPRPLVQKGDILAKRTPHDPGEPGLNVFNQVIHPPKINRFELKCGSGVIQDGNSIYRADIEGTPMLYDGQTLFVTPKTRKNINVDLSGTITPDIESAYQMNDIALDGEIGKDTVFKCQKLDLVGDVKGHIQAVDDISIQGSIGVTEINGLLPDIHPVIKTRGSVKISKAVANSTIECGRFFQANNADIIDCSITARYGIFAKNVYSNQDHPTILKIGHLTHEELDQLVMQIKDRQNLLDKLKQKAFLKGLEADFFKQIQVQDEYRERQMALSYLIKMMDDLQMSDVNLLGPEFNLLDSDQMTSQEDQIRYGIPQKTRAFEYLQSIQEKIDKDPPKVQVRTIQRLAEENYGLYMAAAKATDRMEKELSINTSIVKTGINKKKDQINHLESELNDLILQKEYLLLKDQMQAISHPPEIKIKNQISQGTVVIGKNSQLVIDKTIYGVRLSEEKSRRTNQFQIVIKGYYE